MIASDKDILVGVRIKNKFETLPLCLLGLAFQTYKNFDILIYDESDVPITEYYPIRLAMDLLQLHYNIDIYHKRRIESKNVAQALAKLLDYASNTTYHYLLMLDSDMVMTPTCLEKLHKHILDPKGRRRVIYVEPTVIDVNNSLNHNDYTIQKIDTSDVHKYSEWCINHLYINCDDNFTIKRRITTASIPLIDLHKVDCEKIKTIIHLLNQLKNLPGEDIIMYRELTRDGYYGLLVPSAIAYHFAHTKQHRDWYKVTRQLQQMIADANLF